MTFGGLSLAAATGSEVATQRRRLALLALLAAAGERGASRDRLVAFLWPESASESARHSLEQLLYLLRRQLDEELFLGSDPLRLNPKVITSDVGAFESALAQGADADAVASYRGPFLDGFYLNDAGEFGEWVESERARLASAYAAALMRLAEQSTEAGDLRGAVVLWRQLVALDTLSSRSLLGLARSLARVGDRAEALRVVTSYEALIREQLNMPLDPALQAFVQQLRNAAGLPAATARGPFALEPAGTGPVDVSKALPGSSRIGRRRWPAVLAGAALLIAVTWAGRSTINSSSAPSVDPHRILVVPFRVTGADSSLGYLREGMLDLLAAKLNGNGGSSAIDPRTALSALRKAAPKNGEELTEGQLLEIARGLGAGQLLLGEVVAFGRERMVLNGQVIATTGSQKRISASITGATEPADSVLSVVHQLAGHLLALQAGEHPQRINSLTAKSTDALRSFLEGRAEHRRGNDAAARALFSRALDQDSTFVLAGLELALATARLFRWTTIGTDATIRTRAVTLARDAPDQRTDTDEWERAITVAWQGRDQLSPADRALLVAIRGEHYPAPRFARELLADWERAVRAAPDRPQAHYWLAQVLLVQGPTMGLSDSRQRARASFARALGLDSAFLRPLSGLLEIAALESDTAALRHLRALYLARDSIGEEADYVQWLAAALLRDEQALRTIRARFNSLHMSTLNRILRASQLYGIALDDGGRASEALIQRAVDAQQRQIVLHYAVWLALNRGRPQRALQIMGVKYHVDPDSMLYHGFALRYGLMWDGDSVAAKHAVASLEARLARLRQSASVNPLAVTYPIFSIALWRLWQSDTMDAAAAVVRLTKTGLSSQASQADLLETMLAAAIHRPDAALTLHRLDSLAARGFGDQPHFVHLVSARLHERAGDLPAALASIRRGRWMYPPEYLSTHLREEGRLARLTGDRKGAIIAYRHYLALRSKPEPTLQPEVDQVRADLERLERQR